MTDGIHVVQVAPGGAPSLPIDASDVDVSVESADRIRGTAGILEGVDGVVVGPGLSATTTVDCCRFVADHAPAVPVLVYAVDGSETLAGRAVAAGADGYVPAHGDASLETRLFESLERPTPDANDREAAATGESGPLDGVRASDAGRDEAADPVREQRAVEESAEWTELVVEQAPLAIVEWNLSFEVVRWNGAATELFGYEAADVLGKPAVDFLVPPDDRTVIDHWERLVETGESDRRLGRNVRADGTTRVCEWHNSPLVDDAGDVVGILSFAEDVTEEIRRADALEALQSTTHRLMRARSRSDVAAIAIEAVGDVIDQARAGFRLYDREANELVPEAATPSIAASIEGTELGPGDGLLWEAFADGESRIIDDAGADIVPFDLDIGVGDTIVMPIADEGLLTVAATEAGALGETEYHLVEVLAATATVALERVERDRELRRAKTIVEAVGDGVYALGEDGRFTTVNDSLVAMSGYDRETLLDAHASHIFPEPTIEDVHVTADRATSTEGTTSTGDGGLTSVDARDSIRAAEIELETASGETVPCEVTTTVLQTGEESVGTVGIVRDISDRKAMKQEVLAHQDKVATLHDVVGRLEDCETKEEIFEEAVDAAEGVLQFDVCVVSEADESHLEMRVVSDNVDKSQFRTRRPMEAGLGGKAYLEGKTYRVNDIENSADASPQDDAYRSGLTVPIGEYGVFQAISTDTGAFDERDEELAELLISHVTDALDRLTYEKQLVTERDRFAVLFENVPDAVVTGPHVGSDVIVEDMNSAFEETFGYDLDALEGEPIDEYIASPERRAEARAINDRSESGEVIETEVKRRTSDGIRDFMLRVVPYEVEGEGEYAFGVYTDITKQKQRQKRVEVLNRVLRHDLRNGMNIIEGSAERLASLTDDAAAETYADAIRERTDELIGLAEKTRVVERTLDRDDAVTGPIEVTDAVESAIDRLTDAYPDVDLEQSRSIEALVRADDLLTEAVYNVLENAVAHTDRSDPSIEVSMSLLEDDPKTLSLTIADDGPGIPEEERQLLEEEREITQLRHASGLGLWLVDWVVTQSGGELRFEENDPRGTIVELQLPVVEVTAGTDADRTTASE